MIVDDFPCVWKPRFWFQIAFAELMGDTRELPETPGKYFALRRHVESEGGSQSLPPPFSIKFHF